MTFQLRTAGDPLVHAAAVREIVKAVDSRVPVTNIVSQVDEINLIAARHGFHLAGFRSFEHAVDEAEIARIRANASAGKSPVVPSRPSTMHG